MLDLGDTYPRFLPHERGKSPKAEIGNIVPLSNCRGTKQCVCGQLGSYLASGASVKQFALN